MSKIIIRHSPKKEILVPLVAIENNIDFIMNKPDKVVLNDNIEHDIQSVTEMNILSKNASDIVNRLYKCSVIDYLTKWYNFDNHMDSFVFIYIKFKN